MVLRLIKYKTLGVGVLHAKKEDGSCFFSDLINVYGFFTVVNMHPLMQQEQASHQNKRLIIDKLVKRS